MMRRALLLLGLLLVPFLANAGRTLVAGPLTFTGTDDTRVAAADSTNWTEQDNVFGYLKIFSNAFRQAASAVSDDAYKGAGTFTDDQYCELKIVGTWAASDGDYVGCTLRNSGEASPTHNAYGAWWRPSGGGTAQAVKNVAGTRTQISTDCSFTMAANDLFSAEAVTNGANVDIKIYKNGVLQCTRSDTSSVLTGGKPGITGHDNADALRGDDWTAGNVTASSSTAVPVFTHHYTQQTAQ